jgi:dTDP-glucose 4,6-dehydratase
MKRLLVTGGAGFIGANFCRYWAKVHPAETLVVLDALTYAGTVANIEDLVAEDRIRFVQGDIGDRDLIDALLTQERIDTVVNFAAETHVDRSIENPSLFLRSNVLGLQVLLEAARQVWGPRATERGCRFHHVSTDEVFGSLAPGEPAFTEHAPYAPNSPYAASKAAGDHIVRAYSRTYGLPTSISHCSNNYGPYQFPEKLIPLCIINILEGRNLPVYGDGLQVRDWLHVHEHCRAIDLILKASRPDSTWNVGGDCQQSNVALVQLLCDLVDSAVRGDGQLAAAFPDSPASRRESSRALITHVADRPGHDRRYAIDGTKIRRLGFSCDTELSRGLAQTVAWYLEHDAWRTTVTGSAYREWMTRQYRRSAPSASTTPT